MKRLRPDPNTSGPACGRSQQIVTKLAGLHRVLREYPGRIEFREGRSGMTLIGVIDDQMLQRYRELLDQEDVAFDELEHAYEDGDRDHFEADLSQWALAAQRRIVYLRRMGVELTLEFT